MQTSHTGMALHPAVRYAVGDRLASPRGSGSHFSAMACCSVSTATRSVCANRQQRLEPPAPCEASTHMNLNIAHTRPALARANGIELTYDTFGDAQAPPLVLIMGLAAQMIAWDDEFCAALAARGFRVIRFDNRDIGLSTRLESLGVPNVPQLLQAHLAGQPVSAAYTLGDMARDVVGLLDALGIDAAHVVGASMGGAIAQTLAIEYPQRLRSLTSIMATSGDPSLPPPTPEALQLLLTPTPTDQAGYYQRYVQTWKVLRGPGFPLDEARDLERAAQAFARGLYPAGVARQMAAILASGSRKAALASVRIPTLVIHGDADPLVPVACGHRRRRHRAGGAAPDHRRHGPRAADHTVAAHRRGHRDACGASTPVACRLSSTRSTAKTDRPAA